MKMFGIAAGAMIALTGLAPASITAQASAQRVVVHERTVVRGPGAGAHARPLPPRAHRVRYRNRRVCSYRYRHHHRVRVCRTVRYRY